MLHVKCFAATNSFFLWLLNFVEIIRLLQIWDKSGHCHFLRMLFDLEQWSPSPSLCLLHALYFVMSFSFMYIYICIYDYCCTVFYFGHCYYEVANDYQRTNAFGEVGLQVRKLIINY